jgi:hypothetical protein
MVLLNLLVMQFKLIGRVNGKLCKQKNKILTNAFKTEINFLKGLAVF